MGNAESQGHQHASRRQTPIIEHERKRRSLSPSQLATATRSDSALQNRTHSALSNAQNSSSSFHSTTDSQHQAAKRRINQRRAKSFRVPRMNGGSFRVPICHITGLNENQKQLILSKWLELDKTSILDFGRSVLETVFKRDKKFLRVISSSHLAERTSAWKASTNFRVLVQKFCDCLNIVIRNLYDAEKSLGALHEFGALHYSNLEQETPCELKAYKLPAAYFDSLIFAVNNAAKDLQVESSRGSESPSRAAFDKRFLLPGDDLSLLSNSPSQSPSPTPFASSPFVNIAPSTPRRYGSVCPIAAEAWNLFSLHVVSHIKFGFQMENLLQNELKRLVASSVQFSWQSPSSDENTTFSSRDDGTLDGLSIQTNTTAIHGGGSISSTSNSSNSSSGSSGNNVYASDLPTIELIQHNGNLTMAALVE